ncbi:MAG: malto-oligosyltrehalose synthase [Deltaproteobacteria bacterium]|nr:malto-oligosyltrehalose synthase [Deltaproteobacteria bacterium]
MEIESLLDAALSHARTRRPTATYRVQLHRGFGFKDALAIVPYLDALGITDLYTSPLLRAKTGSTHGYDVVDHAQVDRAIGTEDDLRALSAALRERGMGLLVDVVPNHVGIGRENARWVDVLENGVASIHARFFDIEWLSLKPELAGKILLPILGDHYGYVLERGELKLHLELARGAEGLPAASFHLTYWEERLPIAPRSYMAILRHELSVLEAQLGPEDVHLHELLSILTALENLPPRGTTDPAKIAENHREKEVIKRRLGALVEQSAAVRAHVARAVAAFNGVDGEGDPVSDDPARFDLLDALLEEQAYRVAYWRVAGEEINYRRFFDINGLAAIRQEDPVVFEETHRVYLRLLEEGLIDGMRIDHPDGLYDPAEYLRALQEEVVTRAARRLIADDRRFADLEARLRGAYRARVDRAPHAPELRPLFVVVEKILSRKERVPDRWLIDGTTGYEFLNLLNGLFVERANAARLEATWTAAVGRTIDFHALVRANKRLIMKTAMVSEINVLAHRLAALSERSRRTRDFTVNSLRRALLETVAAFPVYRTYIDERGVGKKGVDEKGVDERDRAYIEQAIALARVGDDELVGQTFDFLRSILLMEPVLGTADDVRREHLAFVMKLQQVTGPVMAKGLEDTTFYVYNRLVSLNEVGGEPEHFGVPVETFHRQNVARVHRFPGSLLATSTHDTKRSEDVRARIDVLSELPDAWERFLDVAREANAPRKVQVGAMLAPDAHEEVLFYQTLLGAAPSWPLPEGERASFRDRLVAYMLKATKEAKVNNSWTNHRPEYDEAITRFVEAVLAAPPDDPFHEEMRRLHRRVLRVGRLNGLAQQLLKIACPGVPDLYQGTEAWDLSLVDPDNRRPVDYDARRRALDDVRARIETDEALASFADDIAARSDDPRLKLFVTHVALRARKQRPELFRVGAYVPLDVVGPRARHVVAFARVHPEGAARHRADGDVAIVAAPRLAAPLVGDRSAFADTWLTLPDEVADALPQEPLRDAFSGERRRAIPREGGTAFSVDTLFARFPLALLVPT